MNATNWIIDVTEADFEERVLKESFQRPVVVDFWAEWCGPCKQLGPALERLVQELQGQVLLARVDVEQAQALAMHFGVDSIPAVKAIRNGQLILEFTGVLPEAHLRDFFTRILPSEADRLVLEASKKEESDLAAAEQLYRAAVSKDTDHDGARVGLARVLVARGQFDEVEAILEPVGAEGPLALEARRIKGLLNLQDLSQGVTADEKTLRQKLESEPKNSQLRYELGCALAQKGRHEEALQMLLSAGELDYSLASTKVREAMVQLFYALGPNHPLSDRYRAELARLLY